MGFWLFMTFCSLLLPLTFLWFGRLFIKHPPKEINSLYGYRTSMSTKNRKTWIFAHNYCGKLWWKLGLISAPITLLGMFLACGKNFDTISATSIGLMILQTISIFFTIILTERALKENFTENGSPRYDDTDT